MNIFILDKDMQKSAMYHPDKHIVKMPLEDTQLLCNAFYSTDIIPDGIYRMSNYNHPCSIWTRESITNWKLLREYVIELGKEYTYRFGKTHSSVKLAKGLPVPELPDIGITPFRMAVPPEFRDMQLVEAYRAYFIKYKQHLKNYTNRDIPSWWIDI